MRIVFFGTSKYCLPVLEALKPQLELVVVMPDRPVGRHAYRQAGKQILTPCATKVWALENKIPFATMEELLGWQRAESLESASGLGAATSQRAASSFSEHLSRWRVDRTQAQDSKTELDLAVVADYGQIIPLEIFNLPKLGTFNIHFSKLPEFRGPSPVQFTLLRGDTTAWITIFKLKHYPELKIKMDSGPILWQKSYPINFDDTTETLYTRLFVEVAKELPNINFEGSLTEQDHTKATFTRFLTRDDGFVEFVDIRNKSVEIYNRFRALSPWPGLWSIKDGKRMKVLKCHLEKEKLVLDEIQFEGKKPQVIS